MDNEVVVTDGKWDGENLPTTYIDFLGQEVRPGDFILYATSSNSSAKLTLAKFIEFKTTDSQGNQFARTMNDWSKPTGKKYPEHQYEQYVEYSWKARVQPLKDKDYGWRDNKGGVFKPVTLNLTQFVKVDGSRVEFVEPD